MGKKRIPVEDILNDWNVRSEDELEHELFDDWDKVNCFFCGQKISLLDCNFSNNKPICKGGCYGS